MGRRRVNKLLHDDKRREREREGTAKGTAVLERHVCVFYPSVDVFVVGAHRCRHPPLSNAIIISNIASTIGPPSPSSSRYAESLHVAVSAQHEVLKAASEKNKVGSWVGLF